MSCNCVECMCDTCQLDGPTNLAIHRCRANEDSCIDGRNCPDFRDKCNCPCTEYIPWPVGWEVVTGTGRR